MLFENESAANVKNIFILWGKNILTVYRSYWIINFGSHTGAEEARLTVEGKNRTKIDESAGTSKAESQICRHCIVRQIGNPFINC